MMADGMAPGYQFLADPDEVAAAVLEKSTWAVLALILEIELFTQEHYKQSIEPEENLSDLYKDVFLFRVFQLADYHNAIWKEKFISRLPSLFAEVKESLRQQHNNSLPYDQIS